MTWSEIPALWQKLQRSGADPADRLETLIKRHKDEIFVGRPAGGGLIEIGIAIVAGSAENWLSGFVPGLHGAATAATAGQLTLVAASVAARRSNRMRDWLKGRSDARWEASVSAGTASWQDEIGSGAG
jgi:hypothetical protein